MGYGKVLQVDVSVALWFLKVYSLILASSFYVINKWICTHKNIKSKILTYSNFAVASCAH